MNTTRNTEVYLLMRSPLDTKAVDGIRDTVTSGYKDSDQWARVVWVDKKTADPYLFEADAEADKQRCKTLGVDVQVVKTSIGCDGRVI